MGDTELSEYLYVDDRRLDSYFEQVASPVIYDKVPVWRAGLKLTGPEADATQLRFARDATQHEKITVLLRKLFDEQQVLEDTPTEKHPWFTSDLPFVFTTFRATRVVIPEQTAPLPFPGLGMWVHRPSVYSTARTMLTAGDVYLLESFPRTDDHPQMFSSFSALTALRMELLSSDTDELWLDDLSDPEAALQRQFARKPLSLLKALGAVIGASRSITTLFRIRATFAELHSIPEFKRTLIGYPIVVAAAGGLKRPK